MQILTAVVLLSDVLFKVGHAAMTSFSNLIAKIHTTLVVFVLANISETATSRFLASEFNCEQVGATLIMEGLEYALHRRVQRAAQERETTPAGDRDDVSPTRGSVGGTVVRDDAVGP